MSAHNVEYQINDNDDDDDARGGSSGSSKDSVEHHVNVVQRQSAMRAGALTSLPLEALLADVGNRSAPWCILLHGALPAALAAAAAPEDAHHRLAAIGVVDAVLQRAAEALQVSEAPRSPQLAAGLVLRLAAYRICLAAVPHRISL